MLPASCLYIIRVDAVKKITYLVFGFDDKKKRCAKWLHEGASPHDVKREKTLTFFLYHIYTYYLLLPTFLPYSSAHIKAYVPILFFPFCLGGTQRFCPLKCDPQFPTLFENIEYCCSSIIEILMQIQRHAMAKKKHSSQRVRQRNRNTRCFIL